MASDGLVLDLVAIQRHFGALHLVFLHGRASVYQPKWTRLCTCLLSALHGQCPHQLFARALPLLAASPDIMLHPYVSQSEESRNIRQVKPTPAAARQHDRRNARQAILTEFFGNAEVVHKEETIEAEAPVLRLRRQVRQWQGHWVRCDACLEWRKVTAAEQDDFRDGAFQCAFIKLQCKRIAQ